MEEFFDEEDLKYIIEPFNVKDYLYIFNYRILDILKPPINRGS